MKLQFLKNHGNYKAGEVKDFPEITSKQVNDLLKSKVVEVFKVKMMSVSNDKDK